jgi:hypothetical protein
MSNSQTVPVDRVRVFDRAGTPLAEFKASVTRSWTIGGEYRAQFTYPTRKTDVVNERVLRFGNWLLVDSSALPPWVGVIDTPRDWSTRNVTVSAYSPEHVFDWRIGPPEEVLTGSAGTIFERLITRVNLAEVTILRANTIWRGGAQRQVTLNPNKLSEYLLQLYENSGEEYEWGRTVIDGKLLVFGNWVPFLGAETGALLHEGTGGGNVEAVGRIMTEDGPIVNSVFAYGDGETWQSKPNVTVLHTGKSASWYGLRQEGIAYSGVTSNTILVENATEYLNQRNTSSKTFAVNALNVGDTFKYIRLGNILNLSFQNIGFRGNSVGYVGRVRIVGMGYNPTSRNKIQCVVKEVV